MRRIWDPDRDTNYYFGLVLLIGASLTLVWAIWREAFDPGDFLVYFLIYGCGYILLFRSDTEFRLKNLEEEVTQLAARVKELSTDLAPGERYAPEENGDSSQTERPGVGELFQELWGETTDLEKAPAIQDEIVEQGDKGEE
ncbi:MAG TPA: hypothetical protein GXZ36_03175 [Firmicutes bacterium]|nr:hypothetical protein [Bacillota bacterium]